METLTEICAMKEMQYYGEKCNQCLGIEPKTCYTTEQELRKHLFDYNGFSIVNPQVQRFYIRYGDKWKEQTRSLK